MKFFIFLSLQHAKAQRFLERELLLCILRSFSLAGKLCQKLEMLRRKWMENETLKLQMRNELDMVERMRMVSKIKIYSEISCRFKLTFYTTFTSTTLNIREYRAKDLCKITFLLYSIANNLFISLFMRKILAYWFDLRLNFNIQWVKTFDLIVYSFFDFYFLIKVTEILTLSFYI